MKRSGTITQADELALALEQIIKIIPMIEMSKLKRIMKPVDQVDDPDDHDQQLNRSLINQQRAQEMIQIIGSTD